jgi:RNA polymerase sigma factor (sigma-70 family)
LTESGFVSFYRERYSRMVVLLIAQGASRADAEDATQEAMVRVWQKWNSIRSPRAYAWKVAYCAFLRQLRSRDRQSDPLDESAGEPSTEPELDTFAGEQQVLCLLQALPPGQRVIVACFYDGLTCEEIAEVIEKPAATVRSQLRHARKALKEMIDPGGQ